VVDPTFPHTAITTPQLELRMKISDALHGGRNRTPDAISYQTSGWHRMNDAGRSARRGVLFNDADVKNEVAASIQWFITVSVPIAQ
jgi:hypothetical protein